MTTVTATQARASLPELLDQVGDSHQPVLITGRRRNAVLLSREHYRALQDTAFLLGAPGMRKSLLAAKKAPLRSYTKTRPR
ncbi:MAG: type II toxin-antitoxin system Phd/YefM family antitoxin [Candidatus Coatesbacteria bacterium]